MSREAHDPLPWAGATPPEPELTVLAQWLELDSFAYIASHDLKEPLRGFPKDARLDADFGPVEQARQKTGLPRVLQAGRQK